MANKEFVNSNELLFENDVEWGEVEKHLNPDNNVNIGVDLDEGLGLGNAGNELDAVGENVNAELENAGLEELGVQQDDIHVNAEHEIAVNVGLELVEELGVEQDDAEVENAVNVGLELVEELGVEQDDAEVENAVNVGLELVEELGVEQDDAEVENAVNVGFEAVGGLGVVNVVVAENDVAGNDVENAEGIVDAEQDNIIGANDDDDNGVQVAVVNLTDKDVSEHERKRGYFVVPSRQLAALKIHVPYVIPFIVYERVGEIAHELTMKPPGMYARIEGLKEFYANNNVQKGDKVAFQLEEGTIYIALI